MRLFVISFAKICRLLSSAEHVSGNHHHHPTSNGYNTLNGMLRTAAVVVVVGVLFC